MGGRKFSLLILSKSVLQEGLLVDGVNCSPRLVDVLSFSQLCLQCLYMQCPLYSFLLPYIVPLIHWLDNFSRMGLMRKGNLTLLLGRIGNLKICKYESSFICKTGLEPCF